MHSEFSKVNARRCKEKIKLRISKTCSRNKKKTSSEIRDRFKKMLGVKFSNPILCGLDV